MKPVRSIVRSPTTRTHHMKTDKGRALSIELIELTGRERQELLEVMEEPAAYYLNKELAMAIDTKAVKPCPFCGQPPEVEEFETRPGHMIQCMTDGCVGPHCSYITWASALAVWNRRAGD